ncbi:MAG TPA: LysR family transcriptional regulator [Rhizomicrobium sp.]
MLDDLDELRTFQRILALGSLSAAALDLGVGLAVVSKRLSALERRAGVRLINRTTRKLSPTEDGTALLLHVERMLDALADAEAQLSSGVEEPHGLLRIAAPITFARIHLAGVAADLTARYPRLDIELKPHDRMIDLVEERIDVAVRIGQPRDSTAVMRKLADNVRVLVAAPSYLERFGRPQTPDALRGHRFLRYGDMAVPWRLRNPGGAEIEVETPCRLRADSGDVVLDWALAGHGITLKSHVDVCAELADGRLERVLPQWQSPPAPIYALFPSARHIPAKSRVFLDTLVAGVARLQALERLGAPAAATRERPPAS